jgi:hypothetical protein
MIRRFLHTESLKDPMNKIVVFHSSIDSNKVLGVVSVPGPMVKKIKIDASSGLTFDAIMLKHKLKQASGECVQVAE